MTPGQVHNRAQDQLKSEIVSEGVMTILAEFQIHSSAIALD